MATNRNKIVVKGADDLVKKLKEIGGPIAKKACRKGTRAGAKVILPAAKSNAPVDTGTLQRNIKVRQRTKKGVVSATVRIRTKKDSKGKGGDAYYGAFQEFGTKYLKGKHFLESAAQSQGQSALDTAVAEIKNQIEELSKK